MKTTIKLRPTDIKVSPFLYGLFYEDINHAADGGLNAELVFNNSFEYEYIYYNDDGQPTDIRYDKSRGWTFSGKGNGEVNIGGISADNPSFLKVVSKGGFRVSNCGYGDAPYGMRIERGRYNASLFLRMRDYEGDVLLYLTNADTILSDVVKITPKNSKDFIKYGVSLNCLADNADASFVIEFSGAGEIDLDYVSLICEKGLLGDANKWKNGRIKKKFADVLGEIGAKMLRFPGGCIVEGDADFSNMHDWRETVGNLHHRRQKANTWCYLQSFAIGFYEYFLLCEELGFEPLPVLNCGILCQIRTGIRKEGDRAYAPDSAEFKERVINAVAQFLYFAKGGVNSVDGEEKKWAALRVSMGHKEPFKLNYLAIGNENWGEVYYKNLDACLNALSEYPYADRAENLLKKFGIEIVASNGVDIRPYDTNPITIELNENFNGIIVDEHVYNTPEWFMDNTRRYDFYDRSKNKVFVGEYGVHTESDGRGSLGGESTLYAAVCEAAFLTGCERNSDVVLMTAYAPLFAKQKGYRWRPDLIWFNEDSIIRTLSYYVQKMFATNVGDTVLDIGKPANQSIIGGVFVGAYDTAIRIKSIKVTDIKGNVLYENNFCAEGIGEWKLYPGVKGGAIDASGLVLPCSDKSLNGYWLDKKFGDCRVECEFEKIAGTEGIILGLGLDGVKDTQAIDKDAFSLWLNYGALDGKVAYEKRFEYKRTAFEIIENKTAEFNKKNMSVELSLFDGVLTARCGGDILFVKNVYKSDEPLYMSATRDKEYIYIKAANPRDSMQILEFSLSGKHVVEAALLTGEKNAVNTFDSGETIKPNLTTFDFYDILKYEMPPYSAAVLKVKEFIK